jgi:hypothetical protein
LAQQKGKVSKKDVQAYLDEHKVEIRDVTKSGKDPLVNEEAWDLAAEEVAAEYPTMNPDGAEFYALMQSRVEELAPETGVRYSDYQLPGGQNYREHLLTLPPRGISKEAFAELQAAERATGNAYDKYLQKMLDKYDSERTGGARWQNKATPAEYTEFQRLQKEAIRAGDELIAAKQGTDKRQSYQSSHWDEPNVLAHVRTNERDVGGVPAMHIEEIQSDWHQAGRKQGYSLSEKEKAERRTLQDEWIDKGREGMDPTRAARLGELMQREKSGQAIPDAPFKTSWPELALKRMIRMAAEEGKTRISWTPGEAQAARYDLSKHLDKVQYHGDTQRLVGIDKNGGVVLDKSVPPEKVPDFIGKDVAQKLFDSEPNHIGQIRELRNADLKVGGEGMKGFYDNMLPKMVEKLGKQHGVKVQKAELPNPNSEAMLRNLSPAEMRAARAKGELGTMPVYYFDIPPAWRDQAVGKGFPLFMSGVPFPLTPVDYDPFAKKEK